ncbi:pilus assembly protein PilP [Massilia cavernae]|uniref:Pilus assembly protein PilP n=1 Tax=Massilia cavernae TaxID=2320864 RepID=A0A418XQT6_9BURK|nr:pilus assembly protein PilP [Massilia cavernae]RJG14834.1 pilus assembly protein PilP [Massilia cavernae]
MTRLIKTAALALAAAVLAGCGDSDVREVQQWMDETRKNTPVRVKPLTEPKTFIPLAYQAGGAIEPFSQDKLLAELARTDARSDNPLKPDTERRKELLETFPLDTMQMVGLLQKGSVNHALLQIDRQVHQVRAGQRIGQNFGVVTGVTEQAVVIREVVQDATGDWVERMSKLELQESKETAK